MSETMNPPTAQGMSDERRAEIAAMRHRPRTITESNQALGDLLAEVTRLGSDLETARRQLAAAHLRNDNREAEVTRLRAELESEQEVADLKAERDQAKSQLAFAQTIATNCLDELDKRPGQDAIGRVVYARTELMRIVRCDGGEACDHVWGIDGQHSNEYCKKCFADRASVGEREGEPL